MNETNSYFKSNKFKKNIKALLKKKNMSTDCSIVSLKNGKNNRVFCIKTKKGEKALLKAYFQHPKDSRDRIKTETSFSDFAWKKGLCNLPELYAVDFLNNLGLYEFVEGDKVNKKKVTKELVKQAALFFNELNKYKDTPEAKQLPNASESCFNIEEHLLCAKKRIEKLKQIDCSSEINQQVINFVSNELENTWNTLFSNIESTLKRYNFNLNEEISTGDRCLSPSDFGYHNALVNKQKKVYFIDFEYSGWDDPAGMICDFFCQPEKPVPAKYFNLFVKEVTSNTENPGKNIQRANILLPFYQIKWCCIILNEFLEEDYQRRCFAKYNCGDKEKIKQLNKAKEYFQRCFVKLEHHKLYKNIDYSK